MSVTHWHQNFVTVTYIVRFIVFG